jgi:DNA polymerase elongation subunit (family B)
MSIPKAILRLNIDGTIDKQYISVTEAAMDYSGNCSRHKIRHAITTGGKYNGFFWQYGENPTPILPHIKKLPAVLILDIETAPMEVFVWGLYKQRISHENVIQDWNILSWAAKWLYDPEMLSDVLTPKESVNRDDRRICRSMWELLDKADVVIAHNGISFDLRKLNARFIFHGLTRPTSYQVIDTLDASRRNFGFSSHKLDYLGKFLTRKGKVETNWKLWKDCVSGNCDSLREMEAYNREDVSLLEEVYMEIRGWIKSHPNLSLYAETDERVCPTCLSDNLHSAGYYYTPAGYFESFRCNNCGSIGRLRKSSIKPKERDRTLISTAR